MTASERWSCDRCGEAVELRPEADEFERAGSRRRWLEIVATYQSPLPRQEPDSTGVLHFCPACGADFRAHVRAFTSNRL